MGLLHDLRDPESARSLAKVMRGRRFAFFRELVEALPKPIEILDVGGTQDFWEHENFTSPELAKITVVNLEAPASRHPNITTASGNACDMPEFSDSQFDVVFSNSVIEHVGGLEQQRAMAREIQRVGKRYFVQTPNRYFPIEPHYMFPFFQFLPTGAKAWLLTNFALDWGGKATSRERALQLAKSVELLPRSEFVAMFPDAEIYNERVLGLTKSLTAYGGF
ncbi:MAG: methyltransferase domain-containing protein [Myxococcota bacterium]|jgi:ubiquinone/menaquinone biosynthesis C-methylase UbiE|nr:methyltransferase domain-containing protein [Myxococcota bacterium]